MALATPATYIKSPTGKQAIYYHTSWACYDRKYFVKNLPIDKITDVAYAFFNVDASGRVFTGDSWSDFDNTFSTPGEGVDPQNNWQSPPQDLGQLGQFKKLKDQGKKFNMHLSVGGWSWSGRFSEAVSTETTRNTFVTTLAGVMNKYPGLFTGISLDWEYLSDDGVNYGLEGNTANKNDAANFMKLLKLLRQKLPGFKLSFCVVAAPEKIKFPVKQVCELVDEVHIMTYDFMDGNWGAGPTAGHHTSLKKSPFTPYSVEEAVSTYKSFGVPTEKLFIGAAFYSRGFSGTSGLGKPYTGGSTDMSWDKGSVDYKKLPLPGSTEIWDPVAEAAYSYDPVKKVMNSYDDVRSVAKKCEFIHANKLGGMLVWESSADHDYNHPRSLMKVIHDKLTHGSEPPKPEPPKPEPPTPEPPKPEPPTPQKPFVLGKVLKVLNKDTVNVRYTDPLTKESVITDITKKDHKMKVNDMINVYLKAVVTDIGPRNETPKPEPPKPEPPKPEPPKPEPPKPEPPKPEPPVIPDGIYGVDGEPFFYNNKVKINCPAGLVWNSSISACDWPKK